MDSPQIADFVKYVGGAFSITGAPHALSLERIESYDAPWPDEFQRRPFTLIFTGPKPGPVLPEGLYACETGDGEVFELYLSPIHTPAPDRQDYQAVFN